MRYYPVNLDIQNRKCLVVGESVGTRKVMTLLDCGAIVTVVSPDVTRQLSESADNGAIRLKKRNYRTSDPEGMFLVIGATDDEELNRQIHSDSECLNKLCNIADRPEVCNFILPSVISRGDLIIAISTSGKSPAFAKKLRKYLEKEFGMEYAEFLKLMGAIRKKLLAEAHAPEAHKPVFEQKASGVILNRLLHKTFFVAKRVRTETGIGDHAVSISYAAIELGRKIFGTLEGKKVLLIGAGEMAELAVEHLIRHRAGDIFVANRTFERGLELAKNFNGKAVRFEEIPSCLQIVDIIISSTGSPDYVIRRNQIKESMRVRKNRPIFFIDIAVPRDIDPEINRLNNSYVYDIDDLKGIIDENIEDRNREALKAERIIDEAVISYRQWYESLDAVPTIVGLREKMETIAEAEMGKTLQSLNHLSADDCEAIRRMTDALINKFLHHPTLYLKNNELRENKSFCIDITRKLFKLDD